jgi:carbon-monoxide dehydrogenase large subunit
MDQFGIGQPVRRKEDVRFLTGRGRYTDDMDLPGQAHLAILRSPHAHARILSLDVEAARAAPGVLLVLTGHDAAADGIGLFKVQVEVPARAGTPPLFCPPRPILQTDAVRYVGDPVVAIVAETRAQAEDALELVAIEYEMRPATTDTATALDPGAPVIWPERGANLCVEWSNGRAAEADAAFAAAHHVSRIRLVQNRVVGNPMEPRVAIGEWNAEEARYELTSPTQGVFRVRDGLAKHILKVPPEKLRVISPDTGGGFGLRGKTFPESAMVLWAAKRLGRPVKWRAGRSETFLSDPHGRDHVTTAEMAFDAAGRALGLRVRTVAAVGAYLLDFGPRIPTVAGARIAAPSTTCRRSTWRCAAPSPTPCRPMPIAAPAGPRSPTRSSGCWISAPRISASGATRSGAATTSGRTRSLTPTASATCWTAATSPAPRRWRWSWRTGTASRRGARRLPRAAGGAASASATSSRPRAARRRNGRGWR